MAMIPSQINQSPRPQGASNYRVFWHDRESPGQKIVFSFAKKPALRLKRVSRVDPPTKKIHSAI